MEVGEAPNEKYDIQPHWMAAYKRLKNEFTEDEMRWLNNLQKQYLP